LAMVEYNYTQKSGYDKSRRRSKDSSMYGYSAIEKGTEWQFVLKYDKSISENDLERIKKNLVDKRRLGKSKSSQYGQVNITLIDREVEQIEDRTLHDEMILYVKSRLALVDENGNPTYDLKYLTDGLEDEQIDWSRTQLRTSTYNQYNGIRKTKDTQRVIINSGSVIVLKNMTEEIIENISKGVGVYLSEGFGEVLINPSFLDSKPFTLNKFEKNKADVPVKITDNMVKETTFERHWFDLAIPRDIDVISDSSVHIYAVDDLQEIVNNNLALRQEQARKAYEIVGRYTEEFFKWLQSLMINPLIKEIRLQAKNAAIAEVERAVKKGFIPKETQENVEKLVLNAFNKFLHMPTKQLREVAEQPRADTIIEAMKYIFNADTDVKMMDQYKCEFIMKDDVR